MQSVLNELRGHQALVDEVHGQLAAVGTLLRALREDAGKLAENHDLRALLHEEQAWLARAEALVREVRGLREWEISRASRTASRRWVAAAVFSLATAGASGVGYGWAAKSYEAELATLQQRAAFLNLVAERVLTMTPAERKEFDALMTEPRPAPKPGS